MCAIKKFAVSSEIHYLKERIYNLNSLTRYYLLKVCYFTRYIVKLKRIDIKKKL